LQSRFTDLSPAPIDFAAAKNKAREFFHRLLRISRVKFNFAILDQIFGKIEGADQGRDQNDRVLTLKRAISRRARQKITIAIKHLRHKWRKKSKKPEKPDNHPDLTP